MNAKQIATVSNGNYFSRFGGKEEMTTFRSSADFALEMQREAIKTYGCANVTLGVLSIGWTLTMKNVECQDETEVLRAEFDRACRSNV